MTGFERSKEQKEKLVILQRIEREARTKVVCSGACKNPKVKHASRNETKKSRG